MRKLEGTRPMTLGNQKARRRREEGRDYVHKQEPKLFKKWVGVRKLGGVYE